MIHYLLVNNCTIKFGHKQCQHVWGVPEKKTLTVSVLYQSQWLNVFVDRWRDGIPSCICVLNGFASVSSFLASSFFSSFRDRFDFFRSEQRAVIQIEWCCNVLLRLKQIIKNKVKNKKALDGIVLFRTTVGHMWLRRPSSSLKNLDERSFNILLTAPISPMLLPYLRALKKTSESWEIHLWHWSAEPWETGSVSNSEVSILKLSIPFLHAGMSVLMPMAITYSYTVPYAE